MTPDTPYATSALQPLRPSPDHDWDAVGKAWVLKPLADIKVLASGRIDAMHAAGLEAKVGFPTPAEKDTWTLKLETAKAIVAKTPLSSSGAAFLANAGITTDAAKADWATRVLANADLYAQAAGTFEKWRAEARTAIWSATTYADLQKAEGTAAQAILTIK